MIDVTLQRIRPAGPERPLERDASWWEVFKQRGLSGFSVAATEVLETDCRYVADKICVPLDSDAEDWGAGRSRTGIVVGAIQSGKTASLLGISSLCLDRGIDVLVVLAGTKLALWSQTFGRLCKQLDGEGAFSTADLAQRRVLAPRHGALKGPEGVKVGSYLRPQRIVAKRAIRSCERPVIIVALKEDDHLLSLCSFLSEGILSPDNLVARHRPAHLVVLDDEADEASILSPMHGGDKLMPLLIERLWSAGSTTEGTFHESLFATYVAFTATPQANFLQETHNPLAPRSFYAALRTPSVAGATVPRELTFREPRGAEHYYCGGTSFYELAKEWTCHPKSHLVCDYPSPTGDLSRDREESDALLGDALRAYLISGALRLLTAGKSLSACQETGLSLAQIREILPGPHSMLLHESALQPEHVAGMERVVAWAAQDKSKVTPSDMALLDEVGLVRRLASEEDEWRAWVARFQETAGCLNSTLPGTSYPALAFTWHEVKACLINEVFPHVKVKVLNSSTSEVCSFEPREAESGAYLPPDDLLTIFVAGNVLSRGLTIEGLCTSVFVRSAGEPAADTQMQMQRWFGYRGTHLPFCRVFTYKDQRHLYEQYHRGDESVRQQLLRRMDGAGTGGVLPAVLEGEEFRATSKVEASKFPLCPGAYPSVLVVDYDEPASIQMIQALLQKSEWEDVSVNGTKRGLRMVGQLTLLQVADLLDQLRYSHHDPDTGSPTSERWESVRLHAELDESIFRPPSGAGQYSARPSGCPYSIAAYLRLWHAALRKPDMMGLVPTDDPHTGWQHKDHESYRASEPSFHVLIRNGEEGESVHPALAAAGVTAVRRPHAGEHPHRRLETLWGSRGTEQTYLGDQMIDYHLPGSPTPPARGAWRPRGHAGLLLFHVVRSPAPGPPKEAVAVGLGLPAGGPDYIAAVRRSRGGYGGDL